MKCIFDRETDCLLECVHNLDRGRVCTACQIRQQNTAVRHWHAKLLSNLAITGALIERVDCIRDKLKKLTEE